MFRKRLKKNSKGEILIENVIFIVLNLTFLAILVLFFINQSSGVVLLEQPYAKQIALLIDSASPGMEIEIDMTKAMNLAKKNDVSFEDVVKIEENFVIVKLSKNSGKEYHFFNDIKPNPYPPYDEEGNYFGTYLITFDKKISDSILEEVNEI